MLLLRMNWDKYKNKKYHSILYSSESKKEEIYIQRLCNLVWNVGNIQI